MIFTSAPRAMRVVIDAQYSYMAMPAAQAREKFMALVIRGALLRAQSERRGVRMRLLCGASAAIRQRHRCATLMPAIIDYASL